MLKYALLFLPACAGWPAGVPFPSWSGNATAPRGLHLSLTEDASLLFCWATGVPLWAPPPASAPPAATSPAVQLRLSEKGPYTHFFASNYSVQYNSTGDFQHRVAAAGLPRGAVVYYRVGDAALGHWSAEAAARTPPAAGAEQPVAFAAVADMSACGGGPCGAIATQAALAAAIGSQQRRRRQRRRRAAALTRRPRRRRELRGRDCGREPDRRHRDLGHLLRGDGADCARGALPRVARQPRRARRGPKRLLRP